jgi:choloylglycine hydrolase
MKLLAQRSILFVAALALLACCTKPSAACTGIRVEAEDGSVVYARTMEFGVQLHSSAIIIPRQFSFIGSTPSGNAGLSWKSKYAVAGLNGEGLSLLVDGVNEKGLAGGIFYFPGYAEYQQLKGDEESRSLAPWEVVTWALTNFATVEEVRTALGQIKVAAVPFKAFNLVPPVHYAFHDDAGNSIVVEYVSGQLHIHDNPVGVITNSPDFTWHLTNLRNYVNLTPKNVLTSDFDGPRLSQFGQGSGMLGLPGDFTPPSRFVRAVALGHSALPGKTGDEAVRAAFHILDSFDIPLGAVRSTEGSGVPYEFTQWTSASDTKRRSFYFQSYDNRRVRRVDLLEANLDATEVVTLPLRAESDVEDLTPQNVVH